MKLILYIGHHKVGSTAIQTFLSQNSFGLLENGTLYPPVESEGAAYLMSKIYARQDYAEELPLNIREPHNAMAFRLLAQNSGFKMPTYHPNLPGFLQMAHMINNTARTLQPERVVLCAEAMANFGAFAPVAIDQLLEALAPDELVIYCSLRRPDDYLASWHAQRLRFGQKLHPLREAGPIKHYSNTVHLDYRKMLEPWITRTPNAKWIIRNYADVLKAGDSTQDFLTQTGIPVHDGALMPGRANPSIPRALLEVCRLASHALSDDLAHSIFELATNAAPQLDLPANKSIELLGTDNRQTIYDMLSPIDAWLGEHVGQSQFFPDLDDMLTPNPIQEMDIANDALEAFRPLAMESDIPDGAKSFLADLTLS